MNFKKVFHGSVQKIAMGVAGLFTVAGCAAPKSSTLDPEAAKPVANCEAIQKKVLERDGESQNQLIRSLLELSVEMGSSASNIESCLTKHLRLDCDPRSCRIREKYFVNN